MSLIAPMDAVFLGSETREHPMHVGGLHVSRKSLVAAVPVALPRTDGGEGNAVTMVLCRLATDVADRCERFSSVHAARNERNLSSRNRLCHSAIAGHSTDREEIGRHFQILPGRQRFSTSEFVLRQFTSDLHIRYLRVI